MAGCSFSTAGFRFSGDRGEAHAGAAAEAAAGALIEGSEIRLAAPPPSWSTIWSVSVAREEGRTIVWIDRTTISIRCFSAPVIEIPRSAIERAVHASTAAAFLGSPA